MKFPETKTRSPFYKMLSPLVEKAPMVPFISSFLLPRRERSGAGRERGAPGRPEPLPPGPESAPGLGRSGERD